MTDPPPDVPVVMRSRLGELDGCWLHVRCRCGRSSAIPIRLMVRQHGPGPYIGAIVPRLACKQCGQKPMDATLCERGDTGSRGGATGWAVPLPLPTALPAEAARPTD